jgi:hypothetical protein
VHVFQNDAMLCRAAGRDARALQSCCWAELGLEAKVTAVCRGGTPQYGAGLHRCRSHLLSGCGARPMGSATSRFYVLCTDTATAPCTPSDPRTHGQPHCMAHLLVWLQLVQVSEIKDTLSLAVLSLRSQHGERDTRLPQLLAAVVHLQHISPPGSPPPVLPPALQAKTEVITS